jgi:very-short-patch-repair endonuclease
MAAVAGRQRGVVSREQLLDAGLTRSAIKNALRTGRLHRLHRGVYAFGHTALPPFGREVAALLACGDAAVLSHLSAAAVWGLTSPRPTVDVTVPPGRRARHEGIRAHRSSSLTAHETRTRHGLRVTSPKRTIIDLARTLSLADVERIVSEAHAKRLLPDFDSEEMPPRLRQVLDGGPKLTKSEAERILLRLVRRANLPIPETNVLVAGCQVDALWREQRVAVEVDSWRFHGHRTAFENDRRRDARHRAAGVLPVRLTARQLVEEPEAVVADLARLLANAGLAERESGIGFR